MQPVLILCPEAQQLSTLLAPALPAGLQLLPCTDPAALPPAAMQAEIALAAPGPLAPVLHQLPALRWVQSTWAGVTPLVRAGRRDYLLSGVKDIFDVPMREYVLGWLLALQRQIPARAQATAWKHSVDPPLCGQRLGILGTGALGCAVARAALAFGVQSYGLNTTGSPVDPFAACFSRAQRLELAAQVDALVCLLPDTEAASALVDSAMLEALPAGAVLLNAGRGSTVDTDAVVAALGSGRLRAAVLDVFPEEPLSPQSPLWQVPNLYITSHTAAPTPPEGIVQVFLDNLARWRAGESPRWLVDFERGY